MSTGCDDRADKVSNDSKPIKQEAAALTEPLPNTDEIPLGKADETPLAVDESVDELGTQALNEKLLSELEGISLEQSVTAENASKQTLEQLSESDRQALIEMTIESSSQKVGDDAEQVLEVLRQQAE